MYAPPSWVRHRLETPNNSPPKNTSEESPCPCFYHLPQSMTNLTILFRSVLDYCCLIPAFSFRSLMWVLMARLLFSVLHFGHFATGSFSFSNCFGQWLPDSDPSELIGWRFHGIWYVLLGSRADAKLCLACRNSEVGLAHCLQTNGRASAKSNRRPSHHLTDSEKLRSDRDYAMELVSQDGRAIRFVREDLRSGRLTNWPSPTSNLTSCLNKLEMASH